MRRHRERGRDDARRIAAARREQRSRCVKKRGVVEDARGWTSAAEIHRPRRKWQAWTMDNRSRKTLGAAPQEVAEAPEESMEDWFNEAGQRLRGGRGRPRPRGRGRATARSSSTSATRARARSPSRSSATRAAAQGRRRDRGLPRGQGGQRGPHRPLQGQGRQDQGLGRDLAPTTAARRWRAGWSRWSRAASPWTSACGPSCPAPRWTCGRSRTWASMVGQTIRAKVIKLNRRRGNVVLSRRAVLEEEREEKKKHTLAVLAEGMVLTGTVKNITDYGAFIDLGGIDGLLHVTDMSWGRIGHPSEIFQVGDQVEVVVLHFDRETGRVSLGYKQKSSDPWADVDQTLPARRQGQRPRGEPDQLRRLRRARARRRGPRARLRDVVDAPGAPPLEDRQRRRHRRGHGARRQQGDQADLARHEAGRGRPVGDHRRALPDRACGCRARCATSPTSAPSWSWSPGWTASCTSPTCRGRATSATRPSSSRRASPSRPRSSTSTRRTSGSRSASSRSSPIRGTAWPSGSRWARG